MKKLGLDNVFDDEFHIADADGVVHWTWWSADDVYRAYCGEHFPDGTNQVTLARVTCLVCLVDGEAEPLR